MAATNPIPAHIKTAVREKATPIHHIKSKDGAGRNCWFVLICPYAKLREMLAAKTLVKPEDYGYVVASGFGAIPEATRATIAEEYGFEIKA